MSRISNPRFPHTCEIYRTVLVSGGSVNDDPNVDEDDTEQTQKVVCYSGKCRSYDHDTTSDKGEVITQIRALALPVKQDEWTKDDVPKVGDRVAVDKLSFTEEGFVIDVRPNNLGTDLLWRYNDA